MSGQPQARVLLATLTERTSARGNAYLSGWAGASNLVAFRGEDDDQGRPTWQLFLVERQPKQDDHAPTQRPKEREGTAARPTASPGTGARPASSYRAPRRESRTARQDRAAREVIDRYGGAELNDEIPF
jgi:hypothetical protein